MKKGNRPHYMEMTAACRAKQQPFIKKEETEKNKAVRTNQHSISQPFPAKKEETKEKKKSITTSVAAERYVNI